MRDPKNHRGSGGGGAGNRAAREALDEWLDLRWEDAAPVGPLLDRFARDGLAAPDVEALLRMGRASYPDAPQEAGALTLDVPLECLHVDHSAGYHIYVPRAYDPLRAWPVVVVAHGGSAGRDLEFAGEAALQGMNPFWFEAAERHGLILLAPLTDRGWGAIGFSILFSAISRVTRDYHVDPDRIYLTGHSMGGHLAWRGGINFGDRWGAVSPMSGGYDYVEDRQIHNLCNVPGYATWGEHEPYRIREFNRTIEEWMRGHGYPWKHHERPGGHHEIFPDQVPAIAEFFMEHRRDMAPPRVQARGAGALRVDAPETHPNWGRAHAWKPGRAIPAGVFHWLRMLPRVPGTPGAEEGQEIQANRRDNEFTVTGFNARAARLYLHPKMVDFSRNVVVKANGATVFDRRVAPDLGAMLELVREFDDRGRIFHAAIDVRIEGDREVPEPRLD